MVSSARSSVLALWISWTLATVAASGIAIVLSIWLIGSIVNSFAGLLAALSAIVVLCGLFQNCVLRRYISDFPRQDWFALNCVMLIPGWFVVEGMMLVGGVMEFNHVMPAIVTDAIGGAVFGVLLGGVEWFILKSYSRDSVSRISAGLIWIILNGVAWASGIAIYRSIVRGNAVKGIITDMELKWVHSVGWLIAMLVVAVITGLALTIALQTNTNEKRLAPQV